MGRDMRRAGWIPVWTGARDSGGCRRVLITVLAAAVVLAGCGSPANPAPTATRTPPQAPTTASPIDYRYVDPSLYPTQDTPLAQASAQLRAVWTGYDVTTIPSRHVLSGMPNPPAVLNLTQGKLTDADAQTLAWAEYRENAFVGWLEQAVQPGLNAHLRASGLFAGAIGNAVRGGHGVSNPPCDLFAAKLAVIPVDDSIRTFESSKGYAVTSAFALVTEYLAPSTGCVVTQSSATGPTIIGSFTGAIVGVETGAIRHDEVLGNDFFAESGNTCTPTTAVTACRVFG
jgi:hypothetical protein